MSNPITSLADYREHLRRQEALGKTVIGAALIAYEAARDRLEATTLRVEALDSSSQQVLRLLADERRAFSEARRTLVDLILGEGVALMPDGGDDGGRAG